MKARPLIFRYVIITVSIFFINSCVPVSETPELMQVFTPVLDIPSSMALQDTVHIRFSSPSDWRIEVPQLPDPWFSVSPLTGKRGKQTAVFTLIKPNLGETERHQTITLLCATDTVTVLFRQAVSNLELFPRSVVLASTAGSAKTFIVVSKTPWAVTLPTPGSEGDWFSVSPTSGVAGIHVVTVTSGQANTAYDDRNAIIGISNTSASSNLLVTQKQTNALFATADKEVFTSEGGTFSVTVRHNADYTVTIPPASSWITQLNTKGLTDSVERFSVATGSVNGNRQGMVIFSAGNVADTVNVFQTQLDRLILTPDHINAPSSGGTYTVELQTNIDYDITVPDSPDWVTVSGTKAMRTDRVQVTVNSYSGAVDRTARIVFKDVGSSLSDTLTVIQYVQPVLRFLADTVFLDDQSSFTARLETNTDYSVTVGTGASGWITHTETRATREEELVFTAGANLQLISRTGKIYISNGSGTAGDSLVVVQALYAQHPFLNLTVFGIYSGTNPVCVYHRYTDQWAMLNGPACSFRIQNYKAGTLLLLESVPQDPEPEDEFILSVSAQGLSQITAATPRVTVLRNGEDRIWLIDKLTLTGYIIPKP